MLPGELEQDNGSQDFDNAIRKASQHSSRVRFSRIYHEYKSPCHGDRSKLDGPLDISARVYIGGEYVVVGDMNVW